MKVFEEIVTKNFSILMIYINPQVKQLSKPMQDQHKNVAYWHMIVKLLKTKIKRKIFKADRRKKDVFLLGGQC